MSVLERIAAFQMLMLRMDTNRWPDENGMPAALNTLADGLAE